MMQQQSPFRSDCLQGKIALITGGGSGIGYEITNQLLQHGVTGAVICGRRESFLKRSSTLLMQQQQQQHNNNNSNSPVKCVVVYQVCDVRDPVQCQRAVYYAVEQFGRLDILVNGAAGNFLAEARSLSPKGFATVMAIDAHGTFNMCHAAYPVLTKTAQSNNNKNNNAIIINISATLQYGATWWQSHPSAAKAAVDSLTRSLALEWGPDQIRVVGIAPGATANTPGTTKLAPAVVTTNNDHHHHDQKTSSLLQHKVTQGIPLGRMGTAIEMGHAAVYLCTADYVTGHVLVVDGGEWLYRPPLVPKEMVNELSRQVEAKSRAQAPDQHHQHQQSML